MPPKTSDEAEEYIKSVWMGLKEQGKPTSGRKVYKAARECRELVEENFKMPGERKTCEIVSELNERDKALGEKVKAEDQPWSVGKSVEHGMPFNLIGDFLEYWRRCLIAGRICTVREIKWLSRLQYLPDSRNKVLRYYYAQQYARRERLWEMEKAKDDNATFDTVDIDAAIALELNTSTLIENEGLLADEMVFLKNIRNDGMLHITGDSFEWFFSPSFYEDGSWLSKLRQHSPAILKVWYKTDMDIISEYYVWLIELTKGSRWQSLHADKKTEIANQLWDEVKNQSDQMVPITTEEGKIDFGATLKHSRFTPSHRILTEVGLNLETGGGK